MLDAMRCGCWRGREVGLPCPSSTTNGRALRCRLPLQASALRRVIAAAAEERRRGIISSKTLGGRLRKIEEAVHKSCDTDHGGWVAAAARLCCSALFQTCIMQLAVTYRGVASVARAKQSTRAFTSTVATLPEGA